VSARRELRQQQELIGAIQPALHIPQNWNYAIDHPLFKAYMHPPHDVGGQFDVPGPYEEKEEEQWEVNTYVTCEVLGWRGIWNSEERRRRADNDLGYALYLGIPMVFVDEHSRRSQDPTSVVATLHHVIVCTLCSCYLRPLLGMSPEWYRTTNYRRRVVRWPRQVLAEFGLIIPAEVEVRIEDSNQKCRFMVMPVRPEGTENWTEEQLAQIVTRDCMIGVALPRPGRTADVHPAQKAGRPVQE
jgi:Nitrile hydratase, alpha chain/Nitrile hydratase beta subunit